MTTRAILAAMAVAVTLGLLVESAARALPQPAVSGRIVFASNRDESLRADVFAIGVGRYARRNLTRTAHIHDSRPLPSPDGTRILFRRGLEGNGPILVMSRAGSGARSFALGEHPAWAPDGRRIAFDFHGETFVQDVEEGAPTRVTTGILPSWSPDGLRIAFVRTTGRGFQFFVVNTDGSGELLLSPALYYAGAVTSPPRWSPDGRWLAVQADELAGPAEIALLDAETGTARRLGRGIQPRWSPDGTLLAFVDNDPTRDGGITVMRPDGSARRVVASRLGGGRVGFDRPSWSPDGRRLAVVRSGGDVRGEQVFVVGADGRGLRRVTREPPGTEFFRYEPPAWMDERTLLLSSHRVHADFELYTMRPDGTGRRRLTRNDVDDLAPVWSPNGRLIAFTRGREGSAAIWVAAPDGRRARRVSPGATGNSVSPSWSPDGRRLAFVGMFRHAGALYAALYVVNANGTGLRRVRGAALSGTSGVSADWSPEGARLVYAWLPDPRQLYVIAVRGGRPRQLTRGDEASFAPRWSPDGRVIAFVRATSCGGSCANVAVATVGPTGHGLRRLVTHAMDPSWSPDGRRLVFSLNGGIATSARDGSNVRVLTRRGGLEIDRYPDWGP